MRKLYRFLIIIYSLITAISALVFLLSLAFPKLVALSIFRAFADLTMQQSWSILVVVLVFLVFVSATVTIIYAFKTGRLRKTRLRKTDHGYVEIGVNALESIALNSARATQAGIKTAKARVFSGEIGGINVEITVTLYSDIEIHTQMVKIQERIKKDIERYTGILVEKVSVNVSGVELVGAKVER